MRRVLYALLLILLVAGAFYAGRLGNHSKQKAASGRQILYYVDPMHPAYKSSKPGIAPDCGMQLEPVYADGGGDSGAAPAAAAGTVKIDSNRLQLAGVQVVVAEKVSGKRTVRLLGRVEPDDRRVYRISAGVDGYVRQTFDSSVGSFVHKDEELASYYSPEFYSQINGYLVAMDRLNAAGALEPSISPTVRGVESAALRLRNLGMSDMQIKQLAETRQQPESIALLAPSDGFIIARNIAPGLRFERDQEFYRIADLRQVWIMADIYEDEAVNYRPGVEAIVTGPQLGTKLHARVSEVQPQFDPATRTLKIRLEAQNPGFLLRPGMFVDVELPVNLPAGVSVPAGAVLDAGRSQRVYVETGDGIFEPRQVQSGARFDDRILIVRGLKAGEHVVAAGTFLVDSESQLKTVASGGHVGEVPSMPEEKPRHPQMHQATAMAMPAAKSVEVVDPKCGMKIDQAHAISEGNTFNYKGTTYYFCSRSCREEFAKHPEGYLSDHHMAER
jgi:Cu(I)/Ag(I) efflux system membrane fusion protein